MNAEEMFKALDFRKPIATNSNNITYTKYLEKEKEFIFITFDVKSHTITITQPKTGTSMTAHAITVEELKAIEKQVEELKW